MRERTQDGNGGGNESSTGDEHGNGGGDEGTNARRERGREQEPYSRCALHLVQHTQKCI